MDPPHPPPHSAAAATTAEITTHPDHFPPVPTANTTKLRLMCSYGGHIVPRPNDKSLFYAGGETRIVSVDRSVTAASLPSFTSHLSRTLFNNRPLQLKYQLPDEDLDSLISVATEEDLSIMLEEHDRVSAAPSAKPSRIRLFLFPTKPEPIGSALLDPKSDSWFSDALKGTGIVHMGQSADASLVNGLMGLDIISGPLEDNNNTTTNTSKNGLEVSAGGGGGVAPESMVLETSSSFGSTSSSVSMSNSPPIGVQYEEADKKIRVPSSASLDSDISVGSAGFQSKPVSFQELRSQVASESASFTIESESIISDHSAMYQMQKAVPVTAYQLPQQLDGKPHQHEVQYIHGGAHYMPQYSTTGPLAQPPYYPFYQIPVHQQNHVPYSSNQPYPVYLVPIRPVQQPYNMSMHGNMNNNLVVPASRPPPHPQTTATVMPPMIYKEVMTAPPPGPESVAKGLSSQAVSLPSSQGQQQFMAPPEPVVHSSPPPPAELDDSLAYTQIYKSQPTAPALCPPYQGAATKGTAVLMSESTMHINGKHHQGQ